MDLNKEYFACLALKHTRNLGPRVWKQLFDHFSSAYEALENVDSWYSLELETRYLKSICKNCKEEKWREKAEAEYKATMRAGMEVVSWFDPRFPEALKLIHDPPVFLYVQGDASLFNNPGVAVVGARECTALGLNAAGRISSELSDIGITVVSGLALGIDRRAHQGGLQGIGSSIAVLGCGLDIDYPTDNYDVRQELNTKGLVVTEHGPGVRPRAAHFPVRNRLISALSLGVLVAEAAHKSGSLITARLAAEQGREVFALPGPLGQPTFTGCHRLIKQGAALVESAEDIVAALRYDFARELEGIADPEPAEDLPDFATKGAPKRIESPKADLVTSERRPVIEKEPKEQKRRLKADWKDMQLNDEESAVMLLLDDTDRLHIDAMGRELDWSSAKISKVLLLLEMRGAVQQLPGMWYLAKEPE